MADFDYYKKQSAKHLEIAILVLIIAVGIFFRFYNLDSAPPGLYPDEAINANDALKALDSGDLKVFYPDNNGREGLFMNLIAGSFSIFRASIWAIRFVPAVVGVLTILGLYLLARELFDKNIAAISSFLMAISFWHVNFSRIAFRAIMMPLLMTFGFYFMIKGLRKINFFNFAISGICFSLGFYTYIGFRFVPFIIAIVLFNYWVFIYKDYSHQKYITTRNELIRGITVLFLVALITFLPLGWHYLNQIEDFFGRAGQVSVFSSDNPWWSFGKSMLAHLAIFNVVGDFNWRHNISGEPLLIWPVGVFFLIGLYRSFLKIIKRKREHGHLSTVHILLLSWFFVMLLPGVLTTEGLPHALRMLGVIPVAMIFAAEGIWWFLTYIANWYEYHDVHRSQSEGHFIATITLIILLFSFAVVEYDKYFNKWAKNPNTAEAFNQNYVGIGEAINSLPLNQKKYVVVEAGGVLVGDIPMPAQTVMFITRTYTPALQKARNVTYILPDQKDQIKDKNAKVFVLK